MKGYYVAAVAVMILAMAGCEKKVSELDNSTNPEITTTLSIGLAPVSRTTLGASSEGKRKVYWIDGDKMALNGVASAALAGVPAECSKVSFSFPGVLTTPYKLLYPASFYKDASTITLPASQSFASGTVATSTEPLAGYAVSEGDVTLSHLCCILELQIKKDAGVSDSNITRVSFRGNANEQVSGDFTIDYELGTLTGASDAAADKSVSVTLNQALSTSTALEIYLVVPARAYASGFSVEIEDNMHRVQTKTKPSSATLNAGKVVKMTEFTFVPGALATEFTIEDVTEEVLPFDYNITGRVVDSSSNPIEGVVVSDGAQCVRTMFDGTFYMESNIANVKFVHISTPSGYKPQVVGGIPKFYKAKADITPVDGMYDFGDYVMTPVVNPNRFTLLITADPQTRVNAEWPIDRVAYKSLDACEDLYDELADVAAGISGREVYGICLGDIVHEKMALYADYNTGLARLGYPTYNVIGNHDNDPKGADDDAGAAYFESYYGPRNYSFNIGGIHFVVLDNIMMWKDPEDGNQLTGQTDGLSDGIWAWLQNDLAMVPTSTKLMVCSHSPMFKRATGAERSGGSHPAVHGEDYGALINKYSEVHAWAGHTHVGFNYVYPSNHRHKRIQVHTLARSTGELWTNEYLAAGTPRGFTIVEVDNGNITWRFHPITRQTGAFQGVSSGYCPAGAPAYNWRDWNYDGSGVAVMKDGSGALTEDYQLHAYPRGAYGDNYVYATVFLWDENWNLPVWTPDGGAPVTMTRLVTPDTQKTVGESDDPVKDKIYDFGDTEFRTWYKTYANKSGASLAGLAGYRTKDTYEDIGYLVNIFRAPADASPNHGTVSVTDRFGNTYSRTISW